MTIFNIIGVMQRKVFDYVMYNERVCRDFCVFSWNSPPNNGLVKFGDVCLDDASVLFYFSPILIN